MNITAFPHWSICYNMGQLWRVVGNAPEGRLQLRRCGWEHSVGQWGSDGYGWPINVSAQVRPSSGTLYLA